MSIEDLLIIAAGIAVASAVLWVCDRIGRMLPIGDTPYDAPPAIQDCGDCGWPVTEPEATVVVDADGNVEWWHEPCAERQIDEELEYLAHNDGLYRDRGGA